MTQGRVYRKAGTGRRGCTVTWRGFFASLFAVLAIAAAAPPSEYEVKAAFLVNFAQFVEWPAEAFAGQDAPLRLGVLGSDPFGETLEKVFQGVSIQGRSIVIVRSASLEDVADCHVLFVSRSEKDRYTEHISKLSDRPVLTVGDFEDFARRGGVINFYIDRNKVRFEANPSAAERRGLRVSAQLLVRAKIVGQDASRRNGG